AHAPDGEEEGSRVPEVQRAGRAWGHPTHDDGVRRCCRHARTRAAAGFVSAIERIVALWRAVRWSLCWALPAREPQPLPALAVGGEQYLAAVARERDVHGVAALVELRNPRGVGEVLCRAAAGAGIDSEASAVISASTGE